MEGIGLVTTSSPIFPTTLLPSSLEESTAAPRHLHCISPAVTGRMGHPPTQAVQISVPPLTEATHRSSLTLSYSHLKPSIERGDPVDPIPCNSLSLWVSLGFKPDFMQYET